MSDNPINSYGWIKQGVECYYNGKTHGIFTVRVVDREHKTAIIGKKIRCLFLLVILMI